MVVFSTAKVYAFWWPAWYDTMFVLLQWACYFTVSGSYRDICIFWRFTSKCWPCILSGIPCDTSCDTSHDLGVSVRKESHLNVKSSLCWDLLAWQRTMLKANHKTVLKWHKCPQRQLQILCLSSASTGRGSPYSSRMDRWWLLKPLWLLVLWQLTSLESV